LTENTGKVEDEIQQSIPNGHHEPNPSTVGVNGKKMRSNQNTSFKKTSNKTKEGKSVLIK
jgi:hypothetical protein